jgi:hypothetical protein
MFKKIFTRGIKTWNMIVLGFPRSNWNDSSKLSDVLKEDYKKSGHLKFLDPALNFLNKKQLTNLGEWKKMSRYFFKINAFVVTFRILSKGINSDAIHIESIE